MGLIVSALVKFIPANPLLVVCILVPALFVEYHKILSILIVVTIVFGSLERVPYSNRVHVVFSSNQLERYIGDWTWEQEKKQYTRSKKLYGQKNPETIRVQKIFVRLLDAMHKGLGLDGGFLVNGLPSQQFLRGLEEKVKAVDSVKKIGNKRRGRFWFKFGTKHLERLNWELLLVKSGEENAFCVPYGKIVVYDKFVKGRTDTEIAVVIAHEIGHCVARHQGENLMKAFWSLALLAHICWRNFLDATQLELTSEVTKIIELYISRREESEADYIGLMLMASAGYDPRAAPQFCELFDESEVDIYESTHPSGRERAKKLNENKVMEKAAAVYEQVKAGQDVEVFV